MILNRKEAALAEAARLVASGKQSKSSTDADTKRLLEQLEMRMAKDPERTLAMIEAVLQKKNCGYDRGTARNLLAMVR